MRLACVQTSSQIALDYLSPLSWFHPVLAQIILLIQASSLFCLILSATWRWNTSKSICLFGSQRVTSRSHIECKGLTINHLGAWCITKKNSFGGSPKKKKFKGPPKKIPSFNFAPPQKMCLVGRRKKNIVCENPHHPPPPKMINFNGQSLKVNSDRTGRLNDRRFFACRR